MVHVSSDIARLRRVVVQRPGAAHERMLPRHVLAGGPQYLLFDDLLHVPHARAEHDQLCAVLGTTAEVAFFDQMVAEILEKPAARSYVVAETARLEDLDGAGIRRLEDMSPPELASTLVSGAPGGDADDPGLLHPLPNLLFTRDLAAVAGELVVVGNARKRARRRESILAWAVVEHHPWFAGARVSEISRKLRENGGSFPLTIEGGDILVLSESLVMIGASERTSWSMIVEVAHELADSGFTRVLVAEMPKRRGTMHLDTVFTLADWDTAILFRPVLRRSSPEEVKVTRLRRSGEDVAVERLDGDLLDALAAEGHPLRAVLCGGGHPLHERREQWTDGANHVALSPGVVVGYARNDHTARALSAAGFRVMEAPAFLKEFRRDFRGDYDALVESRRRYAVQITGAELSRGRGGPRCLTLPVERR